MPGGRTQGIALAGMKHVFPTWRAGLALLSAAPAAPAQRAALTARIARLAAAEQAKVVAWRRDLHEHPELGNEETRTAARIAAQLKRLGVKTLATLAIDYLSKQ